VLTEVVFPSDARIETWVERGSEVPPFYDPMVAKLIVKGSDRADALGKMQQVLSNTRVAGIETNLGYLEQIVRDAVFMEGRQTTRYLNAFHYRPSTIDVIEPGVQSSIQDWPGRTGYWDVGVPPSGPMDALALRLANRLAGNPEGAAGLELTVAGPTLRFNCDARIALAGADMGAELDGQPLANWAPHVVKAGSILKLGAIKGAGCRTYLAVRGGFDVPDYLGSKSTFTLGQFGGHAGRTLRVGDVLHIPSAVMPANAGIQLNQLDTGIRRYDNPPAYTHAWEIGVLYGPHGAPDFFTDADIDMFFATDWEVHYNSSRTGVRLLGPRPEWARKDGGEAGLHPSNIHDNAYAIGAVDFTGDMPVILGPDGPSLGGFVCPATIVQAELWKMGQLRPGDTVRFKRLSQAQAERMEAAQDAAIASLAAPAAPALIADSGRSPNPSCTAPPKPTTPSLSSTAAPATNTCSSNTARWCSTSTCASACMR
jgi:urea carboxylase